MSFTQTWAESMAEVRNVLRDGGQLIAMAGYHGTNRAIFAAVYPVWAWKPYHNDNHEKRA